MNDELESRLTDLNLTETEATVYLNLLKIGQAKLSTLNDDLDIARTSIYNNLNYLEDKGLVAETLRDDVTHYKAVDPNHLKNQYEEKIALADSIIPDIKQLQEQEHTTTSIQVFEGKTGISNILAKVFADDDLKKYFGSYTHSTKQLDFRPEHFATRRIEQGIPAKIVVDEFTEERQHSDKYRAHTDLKVLPSLQNFPGMCFLWDDQAAIYTLQPQLSGVILHGPTYNQMYQFMFNKLWDDAEKKV